jgi:benzoyl-CoA reductase/2-hydroxyglutaryl-CoA dehydratase subunit BcrC/BadD/HgdB
MSAITDGAQSQVEHIEHSRDVIHRYSRGTQKIYDLALRYIYDAEEAWRKGTNAVWIQALAEGPLIYACDAIPVAFTEVGRLGSPNALTVAEDIYQIPRDICSMVRVNIGEWYLRKNEIKKVLGMGSSCESYNIMFEVMKNEGYDVHTIDTTYRPPKLDPERYENLLDFYCREIYTAAKWIQDGRPLDEKKLALEIGKRNALNIKLREIVKLRVQHPTYIKSLATLFLLSGSAHYFGKPEEYAEAIDILLEELRALGPADFNDPVAPLAWSGSRGQEFGIYQAIDEAGGAVLGWMLPTPYESDYPPWENDPVRAFCQYQLGDHSGGNTVSKFAVIQRHIDEVHAKGLILYGYVGCSFAGIDRELQRDYFRKHSVPCITIDGTFQVGKPSGQLITRIRAFIEMLS